MMWIVVVEGQAPDGSPGLDPADRRLAVFARVLSQHGRLVFAEDRNWGAHVDIADVDPVHTAQQAAVAAERLVVDALKQADLPPWPIVRIEAIPELMGSREVATALGVSRQRLHELRSSGRFPTPIIELGSGPIWPRTTVDGFIASWRRRPGPRPRGTVAYKAPDGSLHHLIATADERTGTVWVDAWLVELDPALRWIRQLGIITSARNGTSGEAIYRVPRWEWAARVADTGSLRKQDPATSGARIA